MESSVIAEALGGRKVLGKTVKNSGDLAGLVRKGLPASSVKALAGKLALGNTFSHANSALRSAP